MAASSSTSSSASHLSSRGKVTNTTSDATSTSVKQDDHKVRPIPIQSSSSAAGSSGTRRAPVSPSERFQTTLQLSSPHRVENIGGVLCVVITAIVILLIFFLTSASNDIATTLGVDSTIETLNGSIVRLSVVR